MRLTTGVSISLILLIALGNVAAQSKDDEETVEFTSNSGVEGSANAPSDDEDTVEGSGLPPSQVYTKQTTIKHGPRPVVATNKPPIIASEPITREPKTLPPVVVKDEEKEETVTSISPAIPKITTGRPETGPLSLSNTFLITVLASILLLIIVVIIIIVVCKRKHKSEYTPGRQE